MEKYRLVKLNVDQVKATKVIEKIYKSLSNKVGNDYSEISKGKLSKETISIMNSDYNIKNTIELNAMYGNMGKKKESFGFLRKLNIDGVAFKTKREVAIMLFDINSCTYALSSGTSHTLLKNLTEHQFGIRVADKNVNKITDESINYLFSNKERNDVKYNYWAVDNYNELSYNTKLKGEVISNNKIIKKCDFGDAISFSSKTLEEAICFSLDLINENTIKGDHKIRFAKIIKDKDKKRKIFKTALSTKTIESEIYLFPNIEKVSNYNWSQFIYVGTRKDKAGPTNEEEMFNIIRSNLNKNTDYDRFIIGEHKVIINDNGESEKVKAIDMISFSLKMDNNFYTIYEGKFYEINIDAIVTSESSYKDKVSNDHLYSNMNELTLTRELLDTIDEDDIRSNSNYLEYTYNSLIGKLEEQGNYDLKKYKGVELCDTFINKEKQYLVATKVIPGWTPGKMVEALEQIWIAADAINENRDVKIGNIHIKQDVTFVCNILTTDDSTVEMIKQRMVGTRSYRLIQTLLRVITKLEGAKFKFKINISNISRESVKVIEDYAKSNCINLK